MPIHRIIRNEAQLAQIGRSVDAPMDGIYELACDIKVSGPWRSLPPAEGICLMGNGYWIGPLSAPLFRTIRNGTIQHVRLEAAINAPCAPNEAVGGFAKEGASLDMDGCEVYGAVEGIAQVGGFFGRLMDSDVWGLHNYANITAHAGRAGGITGCGTGNRYRGCWNHGAVTAAGMDLRADPGIAGGIVGMEVPAPRMGVDAFAEFFLEFCTNRGPVEAYADGGGLVGLLAAGADVPFTFLWCGNFGDITASPAGRTTEGGSCRFGGLVGTALHLCVITDCHNQGIIAGGGFLGGIAGYAGQDPGGAGVGMGLGSIESCVNHGLIRQERLTAQHAQSRCCAGGILGAARGFGCISQCLNRAAVLSEGPCAGGIAGCVRGGELICCTNEGRVETSAWGGGGIAGTLEPDFGLKEACPALTQDCVNRGDIRAVESCAGGICGALYNGASALGNLNWGDVLAGTHAGGIAGLSARSTVEHPNTLRGNHASGCRVMGGLYVHRVLGGEDGRGGAVLQNTASECTRVQRDTVSEDDTESGASRYHGEAAPHADCSVSPSSGNDGR